MYICYQKHCFSVCLTINYSRAWNKHEIRAQLGNNAPSVASRNAVKDMRYITEYSQIGVENLIKHVGIQNNIVGLLNNVKVYYVPCTHDLYSRTKTNNTWICVLFKSCNQSENRFKSRHTSCDLYPYHARAHQKEKPACNRFVFTPRFVL